VNTKINVQITDHSAKNFQFDTVDSMLTFFSSPKTYWKESYYSLNNKNDVHTAFNFHSIFSKIIHTITDLTSKFQSNDIESFNKLLNSNISNLAQELNSQWLWSGHSYTSIFINTHKIHGKQTATQFLNYILRNTIGNINDYKLFLGVMIGYEFVNQNSDLLHRRNGEKNSLDHLRTQLEKTTSSLFTEIQEFKDEMHAWDGKTRNNWSDWINSSSSEHESQLLENKNNFDSYITACKEKISDLEKTYEEKLRLSKPAVYWKNAAKKFSIQGGLLLVALTLSILMGFMYFSDFFMEWLKGKQVGIQLNTIQGIVIFGTVLTIYAFFIKVLSKLTFSSFHLMRYSEEREQLVYLYLSLINDNTIEKSSRNIVLQALFSRSDTGLLSADSGPTMPNVSELIKCTNVR